MVRRRLPIGMQTLGELRERNCYYVDKTAYVDRLIHEGKHYFLSRPRRFGKSLFLDTLKELFEGNEELFTGLYIHHRHNWSERHPVVRLSFGGGNFKESGLLEANVREQLAAAERRLGVATEYLTAAGRFAYLLKPCTGRRGSGRQCWWTSTTADPGRAGGEAGDRARQPRLPARIVRGDQGQRRARGVHVPDRHQQVLEGEPPFLVEQPHRPDAGSGLFVDLRVHGG